MAFGEDFLKGFFNTDYLKDYEHASKTFRSNGYQLAPRQKFLFHVYFNINTTEIRELRNVFDDGDRTEIGLLVKSVELPSYEFEVDTLNQYNRKRLVQNKINYRPITITMHDDGSDLARNLWYNYFSYYYKDPSQRYFSPSASNGSLAASGDGDGTTKYAYNYKDTYSDSRTSSDWGFVGESYSDSTAQPNPNSISRGKPPFFRDITIYGFNQHRFAAYVLVNPLITQFQHDTYDYSEDNGMMQNQMTVAYETVKYYEGALSGSPDKNVPGFASPSHYDLVKSGLARPGSTASILGQGGLVDTVGGIVSDLQSGSLAGVIGAIQKAGTAYGTFKGKDLQSIVRNEGRAVFKDVVRGELPARANEFFIPKTTNTGSPTAGQSSTLRSASEDPQGPETGNL